MYYLLISLSMSYLKFPHNYFYSLFIFVYSFYQFIFNWTSGWTTGRRGCAMLPILTQCLLSLASRGSVCLCFSHCLCHLAPCFHLSKGNSSLLGHSSNSFWLLNKEQWAFVRMPANRDSFIPSRPTQLSLLCMHMCVCPHYSLSASLLFFFKCVYDLNAWPTDFTSWNSMLYCAFCFYWYFMLIYAFINPSFPWGYWCKLQFSFLCFF